MFTRLSTGVLALTMLAVAARAGEQTHIENAIFASTNRGRSWSRSDTGMPGNTRINAFGSLDDCIFAGTDSGVFFSRDTGRSWQRPAGPATSVVRILCFATLGQRIYAGTDGNGILVSSDKGSTWAVSAKFSSGKIRCLLAQKGKLFTGTDADGVFVSDDRVENWNPLSKGFPAGAQVFAMAGVNGAVFAGLYNDGLYVWADQAQRWKNPGSVSPLALVGIGGTLVAGHNPGGIFWSDDSGETWSKATANSPDPIMADEAGELSTNAPVWELAADKDIVFAGASEGIYYSEDNGHTWIRARAGLPTEAPGVAFLVKGNVILASTLLKEPSHKGTAANGSQQPGSQTNQISATVGILN
jgi:photosystem II stability/assembly factor-like uncharacterized protein